MIVLGIETSCDETAVALLRHDKRRWTLLSNKIASQEEIHTPYGGIVPELASRRHIEILRPMVEKTLEEANTPLNKIDGISVTHAPGLVGSLLVGLSFAKSLALGLQIPFIGVSHLEGHLNAPFLEHPGIPYPHIALVVSGGHTALYWVKQFGTYQFLGGTRDDAAGEAFDKTAKLLGLGYPGGPAIDRLAKEGNPRAIKFPRPKLPDYDFSFSGLKTAVRKVIEGKNGQPTQDHQLLMDLCASFQEAVIDHLTQKTMLAAKKKQVKAVLLTGGVACNSRLKEKLSESCRRATLKFFHPSPLFCTDNAAMIAYTGGHYLLQGKSSPMNLNALASLDLKNVKGAYGSCC
ncbi:MAG: tRNA (adenosine(37)-N6)-threonylcarbamoyltransferase complex transferase subunit TsaD [Deltaproteobacteria bacterium]|nr:tRNA (adenosine(37)-N6)-threonylcarbamoyltransferase complex transferase subunit TsaD [Deltaproteobacteria bacterium]MBI2500848.1 tRNA (adenosine(37)-N6)-threonylcarbamoyltransferase complex transferase subunit TsaD [Deltaproteobacteria bacterium]